MQSRDEYSLEQPIGGSRDDSNFLQKKIDYAILNKKTLKIDKIYTINSTLNINGPITIEGVFGRETGIKSETDNWIFSIESTEKISISNLNLTGIYEKGGNLFKCGLIRIKDINTLQISSCYFKNSGSNALSLTRVKDVKINNCKFETTYLSGIRFNDPGNGGENKNIYIRGCYFTNTVYKPQAGNAAIFVASASDGIESNSNVHIENNTIFSLGVGIGLDAVDTAVIRFNHLSGSGKRGEGIPFTGRNIIVSNNYVNDFGAAGILWWVTGDGKQESVEISNNLCWDNNTGIETVMASNKSRARKLIVKGNTCWTTGHGKKNQKYGFQLYRSKVNRVTEGKWEDVIVEDNNFQGNQLLPMTVLKEFKRGSVMRNNY